MFGGRYHSNDCSLPLTINILCILTCQLVVHNIWYNAIPYLVFQWKMWQKRRNARARRSLCSLNWRSCCTLSSLFSCCDSIISSLCDISIDWRWWCCLGCCSSNDPAGDASRIRRRYTVPNSVGGGGGGGRAGGPSLDRSSRNLRAMSTRSAYSSVRGPDEQKQSLDLSDIYSSGKNSSNNRTTENASRAGLMSPTHRRRQSTPRGNTFTQTQRTSECREVCDNSIIMDLQYPPLNQRSEIPYKYVTVTIFCVRSGLHTM